ncbi:zinc-dependent metalloprotease [Bifidobacterium leontopitheci]|uniref:Hydrolase n=1 Tax=Bifidobacterium leontopitheci TaxID=2650774 RepID=A0A6I1GK32_9BIFI|nr:zinc-dependent metalloprotease [Bifidobacterium leontopitheci]KAB7789996.1 hydrolase [Bifidobacterium leontopitheci]
MDENAMRQWFIDCFGPVQGEMAWNQLSQLPEEIREQLMSQDASKLPKPAEVQALMQAFTSGGLNTFGDMKRTVESGPINVSLAKTIALQRANADGSQATVSAQAADETRRAVSEANLWLDTACEFDPAPGDMEMLTRAGWVENTLESWAKFAAPVAQSMNDALASVISERLGDAFGGEIAGVFAGPVPIPMPDNMKDPAQLIKLLGNTSFAMQLGQAAGKLSHEVNGSFDQGIALLKSPAGGLIVQNISEYATSLNIPVGEVTSFLALREIAHARLFAGVPWLMPRFEALIGKYARGITIDLDAMEEQLRDATSMDPESISGAVNLTKVGIPDTPEQKEALASLETLMALVEGWVDCVTWRAGMAHIPHIEQLREMMRRKRAVGGPAERTFESLLGMQLRPKRMREAAVIWERITAAEGAEVRDAKWSHPDLLPQLPADDGAPAAGGEAAGNQTSGTTSALEQTADAAIGNGDATPAGGGAATGDGIDWDAELTKLLDEEQGSDGSGDADSADNGDTDTGNDTPDSNAPGDNRH